MKLKNIAKQTDWCLSLLENASAGATSAATIASVSTPLGISRRGAMNIVDPMGYMHKKTKTKKKAKLHRR